MDKSPDFAAELTAKGGLSTLVAMNTLALVLCLTLGAMAVVQLVPGLLFARVLFRRRPALLPDDRCPKAAVLFSVRGPDPFLAECVESLLRQDYPNYDVRIVVDHENDPAKAVIDGVIERLQAKHVRVEVLGELFGTCTLQSNSILQAAAGLDDTYEVVAVLDSDTVPHRTWLRELAGPLADPQVGVTSGNRWYMPQRPTLGALVRHIWNAGAVVQMYWLNFTWGGSVAMRGSLVRGQELPARWRRAIATDTAIYGVVRDAGLKAVFVPSLMIVNRESCGLGEFFAWVRRQLLVGRLQHDGWGAVFLHGMVTSLALVATLVTCVVALLLRQGEAAALAGGGLVGYTLAMVILLGLMEAGVRTIAAARGQPTRWLSLPTLLKFLVALPLTQILYTAALPTVRFMREVLWRGIAYRIDGPWQVRLVQYHPFAAEGRPNDAQTSL